MPDLRSRLVRYSKTLFVLAIAMVATGCSSRTPLPANLDYRYSVHTSDVTLNVMQQVEPEESTALIVDQLRSALPLFAERLPRGLKDDHVDVVLLEPPAFDAYVRDVMREDPANIGAFCLSSSGGRNARLFVQLPPPSGIAEIDALRNYRVGFEAVHEMCHAWLGGSHTSKFFGPSEEGVCNWIATEAIGDSPDRLDWLSNALIVGTMLEAAEEQTSGDSGSTTPAALISKWAHSKGDLAYMLQALYVDWLYWSVDQDDAVMREELDEFLDSSFIIMSEWMLESAQENPQGPPFDSYIDRIAATDQPALDAWNAHTHRDNPAPAVDFSVTASSMTRQSPGRWLVDPSRIALRVLIGPARTWTIAPIAIRPEFTLSYPDGHLVADIVRREDTCHVDIMLEQATADDAGVTTVRMTVQDGRFSITGDGEILFEGEPSTENDGASWSANIIAKDWNEWPADACMVLEFPPGD